MYYIYSDPKRYGLTLVAEHDYDDESWQFNLVAVWRSLPSGELFFAEDSGCSCPSPFEDHDLDSLERLTPEAFAHLEARVREGRTDGSDFLATVRRALEGTK